MNAHTLALALALLAACDDPGAMPVFVIDARDPDERSFDRIAEACDFWGIECKPAAHGRGALSVLITRLGAVTSGGDSICGVTFEEATIEDDRCSPMIYTCARPQATEHEIGHVFLGYEHSDDPDNVMRENVVLAPFDATSQQVTDVQNGADALARCRD